MGGELKAGKEEHQNAAVPTLNSLAHSESLMCQLWPQISPAEPDGQRQVIWDQTLVFRPWWRDLEALGTEDEISLREKKDRV